MIKTGDRAEYDYINKRYVAPGSIEIETDGVAIVESGGKYFWSACNEFKCGCWEEIPKSLYDELLKLHESGTLRFSTKKNHP